MKSPIPLLTSDRSKWAAIEAIKAIFGGAIGGVATVAMTADIETIHLAIILGVLFLFAYVPILLIAGPLWDRLDEDS